MTATTQAAAASGISHPRARLGLPGRCGTGAMTAAASGSAMTSAAAVQGVPEPLRGAGQFILGDHRDSFRARASAARPRAAVDLTVPVLMPSVAAISASDSPA